MEENEVSFIPDMQAKPKQTYLGDLDFYTEKRIGHRVELSGIQIK